jgi:hypothetical protein
VEVAVLVQPLSIAQLLPLLLYLQPEALQLLLSRVSPQQQR